jgi:hypothetical protein
LCNRWRHWRHLRAAVFAPETRELIERLAAKMGVSRTAAVAKAVEEMATRVLEGDAPTRQRKHGEKKSAKPGHAKGTT